MALTYTQRHRKVHFNYDVFTRKLESAHTGCDLSCIVKSKGFLKVTVSHVHFKSGIISNMAGMLPLQGMIPYGMQAPVAVRCL